MTEDRGQKTEDRVADTSYETSGGRNSESSFVRNEWTQPN